MSQIVDASRHDLTKKLNWLTTLFGMLIMTGTGILLYIFAPRIGLPGVWSAMYIELIICGAIFLITMHYKLTRREKKRTAA